MSGVDETIALLRKKRADAAALVGKYDAAIEVMLDLERDERRVTAAATPIRSAGSRNGRRRSNPRSVKQRVRALLDEGPEIWRPQEIIDEYEARGDPIEAANVGNSVRSALWTLNNDGDAVQVDRGAYASAQYEAKVTRGRATGR